MNDEHTELHVLLVEDNDIHAAVVRQYLEQAPGPRFCLEHVARLDAAIDRLQRGGVDVLLLDLGLPDSTIAETLPKVMERSGDAAVIVLTSLNDMDFAAKAVQQGAQDFLLKTALDGEVLLRALRYSIERKKARDRLEAYAAELERSNDRLKGFAHTVAHEVKSPLTAVHGSLENLQSHLAQRLDPEVRDFVGDARTAICGLTDLVNELLEFAQSGLGEADFASVDLESVFYQAYAHLRLAVKQNGAVISHDPLPTVHGSETQLRQLLQNLIGNAIKYRRQPAPMVHVGVQDADSHWALYVRDNGLGIAADEIGRVFDVFYRVHDTAELPGSGIGLAFCKRIVENHSGKIWVESELGAGSTFYFTLPKAESATPRTSIRQLAEES